MAEPSWPRDALPVGTAVGGYRIAGLLGRGGFGITYRALDRIDQQFALKECFPRPCVLRQGAEVVAAGPEDADLYADCLARFLREARALARLAGVPGIVRALTVFEANATAYLVMELVPGRSLDARLRADGPLDAAALERMMRGLLAALAAVHRAGFLHRDVKPANIQLLEDGAPVLIDFGATRAIAPGQATQFTQILSEGYAPIEQYVGAHQGPPADLYALGMTCYRAIGGKTVDAFSRQQAVIAGRGDPLLAAIEVGGERYPPRLLAAIDRAVAVEAANRPEDADALLRLLDPPPEAAIPPLAPPPTVPPAPEPAAELSPAEPSAAEAAPVQPAEDGATVLAASSELAPPKLAPPELVPPAPIREDPQAAASGGAQAPGPVPPLRSRRGLVIALAAGGGLAAAAGAGALWLRAGGGARHFALDLAPETFGAQRLNQLSLRIRALLPLAAPRMPELATRLVPSIDRAAGVVYLDPGEGPAPAPDELAAMLARLGTLLRRFGQGFVTRAAGHEGTGFGLAGNDPARDYDQAMAAAGKIVARRLALLGAADVSVTRALPSRLAVSFRARFDAAWAASRAGLAGEAGFGIGYAASGFLRAARPQLPGVAVAPLRDPGAPAGAEPPVLSWLLAPELSGIALVPPGAGARLRVGLAAQSKDVAVVLGAQGLGAQGLSGAVAPPDSIGLACLIDRFTGPASGASVFAAAASGGDVVDPLVVPFALGPIGGRSLAAELEFDLAGVADAAALRAAIATGPLPAAFGPALG